MTLKFQIYHYLLIEALLQLRIGDRIALMKDGEIVQIGSPEEILMSPSNEYVERFVEDVDLSKVLTAGHIMKKADTVKVDRGPRVALRLMKHLGISSIYVVDNANRLLGAVTAQDTVEAIESEKSLNDVIISDLPMISPDTVRREWDGSLKQRGHGYDL